MISSTVSWPELSWTVVALVGLIINAWALWDAAGDWFYLQTTRLNGARRIIARGNVIEEGGRCIIQTVFFIIGLTAMVIEPTASDNQPSPGTYVAMTGFISVAVLMVLGSIRARRDRIRLMRMIRDGK